LPKKKLSGKDVQALEELAEASAQAGSVDIDLDVEGQDEFDSLWLVEALRLVRGQRRKQYGHIYNNWSRLQPIASAIFGTPVSLTQIAYFIMAMKMCRELSNPHPDGDNNRDIAGFVQCLQDALSKEAELRGTKSA
jgi:hypothetical protein